MKPELQISLRSPFEGFGFDVHIEPRIVAKESNKNAATGGEFRGLIDSNFKK